MAGSITPLPIMLLEEEDRKRYEALQPPRSMVVRYGHLQYIAELPYDGKDKPGCGSKLVVTTSRGTELAEMLTTTCSNSGCGKSVSRKQMLQYIENSGGKDYPFSTHGKVLRVATVEDVQQQQQLEARKMPMIRFTKNLVAELGLQMKLVEIEMLLGGERIIFHYISESWVDFRELVKQLAAEYQTRIEMHQVNARDEARLVADYEKCGQHCCCKQFLKVLKPVSMRSAKVQKATLDPTKISGRCGRLMCCLRYEDQTYEQLRKRLPHRQTRVMTDDGPGTVIDTQILTQLVLIVLDNGEPPASYPLENIEILKKDHPDFRKPEPGEPPYQGRDRREPARRGPAGGSAGGPSGGGPGSMGGGRAEGGVRDESQRGGSGRGGQGRGSERRGERGEYDGQMDDPGAAADDSQVDMQGQAREPERPRPGRPLADDQVQSREGSNSSELPVDDASQPDGRAESDAQASHDAMENEGATGARSGRRRRRGGRRNRREGHEGQRTADAGQDGQGDGQHGGQDGGQARQGEAGEVSGGSHDEGRRDTRAAGDGFDQGGHSQGGQGGESGEGGGEGQGRRRRRRRGRRGRGGGSGGGDGSSGGDGQGPSPAGPADGA